jgi:hypothetical protein
VETNKLSFEFEEGNENGGIIEESPRGERLISKMD